MTLHEIIRVLSRYPRYISRYIAENRFPSGQWSAPYQQYACAAEVSNDKRRKKQYMCGAAGNGCCFLHPCTYPQEQFSSMT